MPDADPAFRADVLLGLAATPKAVPARWLYDQRGSELFEEITRLPEYYPTRVETALLAHLAPEFADAIAPGSALVEFGSGSSVKTPLLIRAVHPGAYVPVDISGDFLRLAAAELGRDMPSLPVLPVEADFTHPLSLPPSVSSLRKLGFFPGSTIGNLVPETAVNLLRSFRTTLETGAQLLIGMDRVKDPAVLVRAYDDGAGVTATFNCNLLHRINAELEGTVPVEAFRHRALWNEALSRVEMHLEATRDLAFEIAGRRFAMKHGETIHTENSHKYGPRDARLLLRAGGWTVRHEWTDEADQFAILLAEAEPPRFAP